MASKAIPAAEARKRLEEAESSLIAYKLFLQEAGLEVRAMRRKIDDLLYELDTVGIKRAYNPPKINLLGGGEYETLMEKYVNLLGEHEKLKRTAIQTAIILRRTDDSKLYEDLKGEFDQLADELKAEKEKRAKAGRRPHIKPEVEERILKLHEQGLTQVAIAKTVGYSVFTVNRVIHRIIN